MELVPRPGLASLLIEMDNRIGFTEALVHAGGKVAHARKGNLPAWSPDGAVDEGGQRRRRPPGARHPSRRVGRRPARSVRRARTNPWGGGAAPANVSANTWVDVRSLLGRLPQPG
jgi:hypothetical protein